MFECPSCGCHCLQRPAYAGISDTNREVAHSPPYELSLGAASYQGCPCCGFEFGFNDNPGDGLPGQRFSEYRATWLAAGGYDPLVDEVLPTGAFCTIAFDPID